MRSLTQKLFVLFIAMAMIPFLVGLAAVDSLQEARETLDDNNQALAKLTHLLVAAEDMIRESTLLQDNAKEVTDSVVYFQEDTYAALKNMDRKILPKTFAIARIRFSLADATSAERGLLLGLTMRNMATEDLEPSRETQRRNLDTAKAAIESAGNTFVGLIETAEERKAWDDFQQALAEWRINHEDFMREIASLDVTSGEAAEFAVSARNAYETMFLQGKAARRACEERIDALARILAGMAEANVVTAVDTQEKSRILVHNLSGDSEAAVQKASDISDQIARARTAAMAASAAAVEALQATSHRLWSIFVFAVVGVVAALILGFVVSWRISTPVRTIATHLGRIAQGDVNDDVPPAERGRRDEIGMLARAMQDMIDANRSALSMANAMARGDYTSPVQLRSESDQLGLALRSMLNISNDTLTRVSTAVGRVGNGAEAVAEASRTLSQGAQTSAQAVEEIAQTVHHVDGQAKDNAANADRANQLATASRDAAQRGYGAMKELVQSMGDIREAGRKIATVAKLIDDIAFQTNLLALNAAVEAARAGRQGRGFSVVADEVRNLSGRSAKAARETSAMVEAMTSRMEAGALLAERTDGEFREIVQATSTVAQLFSDINTASNAQSHAMAQISLGLAQIDEVIQENTHTAARTASSAGALNRQAGELRSMVAKFRLLSDQERDEAKIPMAEPEQAMRQLPPPAMPPDERDDA